MRKIAVVYWSGTGNTEAMAGAVAEGVKEKGGEAVVLTAGEFDPSMIASFDGFAFGCPSMGSEQLEDSEFEPMFDACKGSLAGKPVALFGSTVGATANGCATGRQTARQTGLRWLVTA